MRPRPQLLLLLLVPLAGVGVGRNALTGADTKAAADNPSGRAATFDDVRPLFQAKCVRCHGEKVSKADLNLTTIAGVLKGAESGPVVVPGKPDKSPLYEQVHSGMMPPGKKDPLSDAEVGIIRDWIAGGAKPGLVDRSQADLAAGPAVTQHDVIPIMLRRCTACHGRHRQEGGLDLRTKAAMLRGGKSGAAIVPGKPAESLLLKKLRTGQMPPPDRLVEASVQLIIPVEIEVVGKWVAAGAPEVTVEPDVATTTPDPLVSDKDREFWAFQPPRPVVVPTVRHTDRIRNPIDAFVLHKLEEKGLTLSPEADRLTLLRRLSFDLTGLPPDPAEVREFLADSSPNAYEKAVDRLLASPRYGERWGRHWLDLAGYADSEGKREQDLPRPNAWRYRDYVIDSFNADKPFDRFLLEQIAGDELADYESAPEITQELYANLVATGFLRMAPDATWANITGSVADRVEVVADEIDVLGSAVMGLTLKCARCHTHKFDPIPQRDYYRLVAVFKGAYDEYDWLKPDVRPGLGPVSQDVVGGRLLPFATTAEQRARDAHNAKIRAEVEPLRSALDEKEKALTAKFVEDRLTRLPDVLRDDLRAMLATAPDKRDTVQKYLAGKFEGQLRVDRNTLKTLDPAFKILADETDARIATLTGRQLPAPQIQALWDRGEPTPTYVYRRGDPLSPARLVGPGVPSMLTDGKTPFEIKPPWPGARKTGRRLAFARWLTRPDHPLTARVAVNRLWKHHFGSGIVPSLGNFGKTGTPPTHPELLDWLAREFVRQGWSVKGMHRTMVTSATYRQSSNVAPELEKLDPANTLYSRMPLARLDAESLYDSLLLVAGRLDETRGGPADPVQTRKDGLVTPVGTERGWRRLLYVRQTRKQLPTHLETFDFPQMNPNCVGRRDSTVAPQALHLMNNGLVDQLAGDFARRVRREAGVELSTQVEKVYLIALGRHPSAEEKKLGETSLRRLVDEWTKQQRGTGKADPEAAGMKALSTYCHAILNSAGFLYVD
ncbi:MAG: putative rane protein [Gemmataceae bacterium]|nr:putative rane protein [Gemmataceae bacterium]